MKRLTISDFSKGIIRDVNPERVPNEALYDALNYEYRGVEGLARRYGVEEYADLNWIIFRFALTGIKSLAIWYPSVMPKDAATGEDKIFFIQDGDRVSAYYYLPGSGGTEVKQTVLFAGAVSAARYAVSNTKVLIADGVHPVQQVLMSIKKELVYGQLGIEAPRGLLSLSLAGDDSFYVEYTAEDKGMSVERGNILQYCYTVEDRYGAESAPSPIVTESRLMWKYKDALGPEGFRYYWYRAKLLGISLSQYPESVRDRLRYVNIYRRDIQFLSGTIATNFVLVKKIESLTVESYDDNSAENLKSIDYSARVAPVSTAMALAGSVVFANSSPNQQTMFPFNFNEYLLIRIDNDNSIDYVNAIIAFKVPWVVAGEYDLSSVLSDVPGNIDKIRLYFGDLTTPLPVLYKVYESSLLIITRIPHLDRNQSSSLYFCVATAASGVTDPIHQTVAGGRFTLATSAMIGSSTFFPYPQVVSSSQRIVSYHVGDWYFVGEDNKLPNKSNEFSPGICDPTRNLAYGTYTGYDANLFGGESQVRVYGKTVHIASEAPNNYLGQWHYSVKLQHRSITVIGFGTFGLIHTGYPMLFFEPDGLGLFGIGLQIFDGYIEFRSRGDLNYVATPETMRITKEEFGLIGAQTFSNRYVRFSVLIQPSGAWAIATCNSVTVFKKVTGKIYDSLTADATDTDVTVTCIGMGTSPQKAFDFLFLDVRTNQDEYAESEIERAIKATAIGMPHYRTQIGVSPWLAPANWNNGATVRIEHKEIDSSELRMTNLQWSDITGNVFPSLNFIQMREPILAIISVPGFLKTEYQNTVIAFTRNTVTRLVLSNDLSTMASRVDNVVEEFPSGGLYAPRSLANTPFGIVWLAEEGVMVWSSKGFQNVSKGAINIDHRGRPNDFVAAYFAAGGQYLLFDRNEESEICWVLHLDTMVWTRFSGFKFESTANLSLGSDYDNQMLLLTDDVVYAYPGTELTDQTAEIVTKRYYLDNIKPVRFRLAAEPMPDYVRVQTYNNEFATNLSISTVADFPLPGRLKWVMIPNGFWGEYLQLSIRNADELLRIDIDLKEGV